MARAWLELIRSVRVREELAGAYGVGDGTAPLDRAMSMSLSACTCDLPRLMRGHPLPVEGLIGAEGLGERCAARGALHLERGPSLRYAIEFVDQQRRQLRLEATRRLSLGGLPAAITVVQGRIQDAAGQTVGWATVRFDPRCGLRLVRGARSASAPLAQSKE